LIVGVHFSLKNVNTELIAEAEVCSWTVCPAERNGHPESRYEFSMGVSRGRDDVTQLIQFFRSISKTMRKREREREREKLRNNL
jgi:hypothetical protein